MTHHDDQGSMRNQIYICDYELLYTAKALLRMILRENRLLDSGFIIQKIVFLHTAEP